MWDVGRRVEESVDAVAAVAPHHREAVSLGVLLDDVPQLSVANAGLHCGRGGRQEVLTTDTASASEPNRFGSHEPTGVDGLHQAFVRRLHQLLRSFLHLSHEEGFVQVAVETVVVDRDVHCGGPTCLTKLGRGSDWQHLIAAAIMEPSVFVSAAAPTSAETLIKRLKLAKLLLQTFIIREKFLPPPPTKSLISPPSCTRF